MKSTVKIIFCILVLTPCSLQAQNKSKYLLNNDKTLEWSIYLAPEMKYTSVFGIGALYGGVKGAILFDNQYAFGLALGGFLTETDVEGLGSLGEITELSPVNMYGGFYLDYITDFDTPFQISFPTIIGAGGVMMFEKTLPDPVTGLVDEQLIEGSVYMVIEPAVNLEINLAKTIRIGTGVGYRFIMNSDLQRFSDKDLAGPSLNLNIKLGVF